ncbi:MAG: alpha/beta fold hydrolase [Planctomycetota bacterium]|jgi:pimeloyl-ACP methyl ester carboxylesterase
MKIPIDDLAIHCEEHGTGEPALLFVHGFPLSGALWEPLIPELSPDFHMVVPDLRGLGRSEGSAEVSMARFADDLAEILDATVGTAPVVVIGLSLGGYIAFEFCRRHRERVLALVAANTRAQADSPENVRIRHETAGRVLEEGSSVVADSMVEVLFGPATPAALRERWRGIMAASKPEWVAATLGAMARRPDSLDTLRELGRPTLIIVGEHDSITPVSEAVRMRDASPGARLEVIPNAGHMTPVETPGEFAQILRRFLKDSAQPGAGRTEPG